MAWGACLGLKHHLLAESRFNGLSWLNGLGCLFRIETNTPLLYAENL